MAKRMTVVFDDEQLYTKLKVEAARTGVHAKDIVALAVREWLDTAEDAESQADLQGIRSQWEEKGGVEANRFFQDSQIPGDQAPGES
jgi:hypothetical protein